MMMTTKTERVAASFRDPSGFLFLRGGKLYRQVNLFYRPDYDMLMTSGLYEALIKKKRLVSHIELDLPPEIPKLAYKIIEPERVGFISYPYEWSFNQLKDAALTTLRIMKQALNYGMILKDASAYNIQFSQGRPVLIDTLSFETYREGEPWVAYRQFCQHFLAPLALMRYSDIRLNQLLRVYIDGIPLDLASRLLPWRTRLNVGILSHVHLHANTQQKYAGERIDKIQQRSISKNAMLGLLESLRSTVKKLTCQPAGTEWADYYGDNNYTNAAFNHKQSLVKEWATELKPATVWDLGGNTGAFSQTVAQAGAHSICFDIDPAAVDRNYLDCKVRKEERILPLVLDLTNPSPALGWANQERESLLDRAPANLVMALALVHHMAISNNVSLPQVAEFLSKCGKHLIIEFIPKEDSQVQRLFATRLDIFDQYNRSGFEQAFSQDYKILKSVPIEDSLRILYLMERK